MIINEIVAQRNYPREQELYNFLDDKLSKHLDDFIKHYGEDRPDVEKFFRSKSAEYLQQQFGLSSQQAIPVAAKWIVSKSKFSPPSGLGEDLRAWFGKGKKGGAGGGGWDRYNTKGERIGKCGDSKKGEGKPKCLSKSRAASLRAKGGKKAIGAAVSKKRRKDPNKNRRGKAKNVSNTKGK